MIVHPAAKAVLGLLILGLIGCNEPSSSLKGQRNATITFHGLTVDQDGKPLPNVRIAYVSEEFPSDWSFEKRGEPLQRTTIAAVSGGDGRFKFTADTHVLFRLRVDGPPGYRHFYEQENGWVRGRVIPNTHDYLVISWGDLCYKSDPEHPAVYVFIKDGLNEVSALPCRGGYDSGNGTNWVLNTPAWPMKPSLNDVVQKRPPAQPTTMP